MPIKIFAAPGDHRDDFEQVEMQCNEWVKESKPKIVSVSAAINQIPAQRDIGNFMLTLVVHYESNGS